MNFIDYPVPYQSAFRAALFILGSAEAADGLDVEILPAGETAPLGVKRVYGRGAIAVNAAPYVRGLLSPQPLCDRPMGMLCDERRYAGCRIAAGGYTSAAVYLTAGTEDAPTAGILSAAPQTVKIRPGEKDEISVITAGAAVKPFILFTHGGVEYTVDSLPSNSGTGMHTFVADADAIAAMFAEKTGAEPSVMRGFSVALRISAPGGDIYLTRRYEPDAALHNGRRLAWVNRYGAVDYHTFPAAAEWGVSGARERIETEKGTKVVATSAAKTITLESEYEEAAALCWLAEIFSSPKVWTIDGGIFTEIDVAASSAAFDPRRPGRLAVKISPVSPSVSRKF